MHNSIILKLYFTKKRSVVYVNKEITPSKRCENFMTIVIILIDIFCFIIKIFTSLLVLFQRSTSTGYSRIYHIMYLVWYKMLHAKHSGVCHAYPISINSTWGWRSHDAQIVIRKLPETQPQWVRGRSAADITYTLFIIDVAIPAFLRELIHKDNDIVITGQPILCTQMTTSGNHVSFGGITYGTFNSR